MQTITSKDGTSIAFDQTGTGPAVILIGGGPNDRSANTPLAALLESHFTVINYDRRGRGGSGMTEPYSPDREVEDLDALIQAAGGSAYVYGTSSGAAFAILAASCGLNITKLALWEAPFVTDDSRPAIPKDYKAQLSAMIADNRRGDALEYFMTQIVGMPAQFVAPMRQSPFWGYMENMAHVIVYEADVMGDYSLPTQRLAAIKAPTLVIDGGQTPWMSTAANAVADALVDGSRRTLAGQAHNVDPAAIAPVLVEFFES
ncbi:MAG: alpha/beta hydrolase [Chloroflexota bacterium]